MNIGYILTDGLELGLLFSFLALGVFMSFRVLDFADLSAEGTIVLGSSVMANLMMKGQNIYFTLIVVVLSGFIAGTVTGLLHTKLKIPPILAGIIVMTGLYSVNLRILGTSNISLGGIDNIFTPFRNLISNPFLAKALALVIIVLIVYIILYLLFGTELGMSIRASGMNKKMAKAQGINTDLMIIIGLGISNAIIALGGGLIAQYNNVANLSMGRGTIVIGLASIIIGEAIFGKKTFKVWLLSIIFGSVIYQMLIGIAISVGLNTNDLQLVQAILIAIILATPVIKQKYFNKEVLAYDKFK